MRLAVLAALALATTAQAAPVIDLATLKAGDRGHRFEATSVYLDAADRPMGARFMHRPTGFQLDLLQIESVPQAFTWVKTFATSDQGEPHTQEHLLLLRGIRGRTLATKEQMSLATSSAYTETWRTSYFFNTSAGVDTFFDMFAEQQRAMLHPDYSDAEIRLEVRNFGVTKSADGSLRLEEKGTVYNEMVASMANGSWQAWRAQNHAVYGTRHTLSYNQGGEPAGIRTMTPADIRRFHAASHHLANMGTVAAFSKSAALDDLLARFDRVLMTDAPKGGPRPADSLAKVPKPAGDPEGALRVYEYPHTNAQQPSPVAVVWPASRELDAAEQLLAELFFANLAGDASTNLYGLLIDSRSRRLDTGARSVDATVQEWGGHPVSIEINDVRPAAMTDDGLRAIRAVVVDEIQRIAAFADGSAELKAFNERIASRVAERERQALKFLGTPPGFGSRNGSSAWVNLLLQLEHSPGNRKSLVLKPEFTRLRTLLDSNRNVWREALARWKITGVVPYVIGARPSATLIAREQAERDARLAEETERLKRHYGTADAQQALARHAADADAELARIDQATRVPPTPFVKAPPMTLDDELQFESVRLANGVPLVASRFDSMTGAMTGLALRLDGVPRGRVALPVPAARPAHPRRRDRQRPAHRLRADERAPAPRNPRAHGRVRHQCPHGPGGAGAARLGRGAGGIPPCARLDGARAVCARLAKREPAAPARPGRPAARGLAQHGAAPRGVLGQRPRQCLAHAASARLAGERLLPDPHAQRPAPALAAAGPGARRRRGARRLPDAARGKRPHAGPHRV